MCVSVRACVYVYVRVYVCVCVLTLNCFPDKCLLLVHDSLSVLEDYGSLNIFLRSIFSVCTCARSGMCMPLCLWQSELF